MLPEYKEKIAASKLYWETDGKKGAIANLMEADLREANLRFANLMEADLREANLRFADLTGAYLREADLTGAYLREANLMEADLREANLMEANLTGANLTGANLTGAKLSDRANPSGQKLFKILLAHTESEHFDQSNWCGTNCCLGGAAGSTIGNQSAGPVLIKIVIPEFDLSALYQSDPQVAIAALKAVEHIYG